MAERGGRPDPNGELADRLRGEQTYGAERKYFQTPPSFQRMAADLESLAGAKPEEKGKVKERLEQDWEHLMGEQLGETEGLLDGQLLRFKNAYPYDSRTTEMWHENLRSGIRLANVEGWANEETKAWLERVRIDAAWGDGNFRLLVGMSGVLDKFYDGKLMLQWVRERFRSDPVEQYWETTFQGKVPGLELPEAAGAHLTERTREGLRERAIKYQDESYHWRIAVAAVSQWDPDNPNDPEALVPNISTAERIFLQTLFRQRVKSPKESKGWVNYKGQRMPETMLNWYSMSHVEAYKRNYIATMQALLLTGAKRELDLLLREGEGNRSYDAEGLEILVKKVEDRRSEILAGWFSGEKDLNTRLAGVVVKSGIVFDWGHMCSAPMSWAWTFSPEKEDETVGVKEMTSGLTTTATDSNTPAFWAWNEINTRNKGWSHGFFPPADEKFRGEVVKNRPDRMPTIPGIENGKTSDAVLNRALAELWSGEWDPRVKPLFEKMAWGWKTPDDPDGTKGAIIPIFIPPSFTTINFWDTLTLSKVGGKYKIGCKDGAITQPEHPTVWDELRHGAKMSEFEWKNMGDQAFYRWLITIGQLQRVYVALNEPESDDAKLFFGSPTGLEEFIKRVDLGTRDERYPGAVEIMGIAPLLVVLNTVKDKAILSPLGNVQKNRVAWAKSLALWMRAFNELPSAKPPEPTGYQHFGTSMAKLVHFYATLFARLGATVGKKDAAKATANYARLKNSFDSVGAGIETTSVEDVIETR